MDDVDIDSGLFGEFEGQAVHAVIVDLKAKLALWRTVSESDEVTVVLTGTVGPPRFERRNGMLHRVHKLDVYVVAEPEDRLADEAESFLADERSRLADEAESFLADERRRIQAEQDSGNRDQQSIGDVIDAPSDDE